MFLERERSIPSCQAPSKQGGGFLEVACSSKNILGSETATLYDFGWDFKVFSKI